MTLDALKHAIKQQRGVTTLGFMGFGVEVDCDELEALIAVTEAAQGIIAHQEAGDPALWVNSDAWEHEYEAHAEAREKLSATLSALNRLTQD